MAELACVYNPSKIHPTQNSLVFRVNTLRHDILVQLKDGSAERCVTVKDDEMTIDFAEYGITNPVLARGCIGLLELGILRDPSRLVALLREHHAQNEQPANSTLGDIIFTPMGEEEQNNPQVINDVMDTLQVGLRSSLLSGIYSLYSKNAIPDSWDRVVEKAMRLDDQKKAISYLDTFIKTYTTIRRLVVGHAETFYQNGTSIDDALTKLVYYVNKNLLALAKIHEETFIQDGSIYDEQACQEALRTKLKIELSDGASMLENTIECPASRRLAAKSRQSFFRQDRTILFELDSGKRLRDSIDTVDQAVVITLRSGEKVPFYRMRACPFVSNGNHVVSIS